MHCTRIITREFPSPKSPLSSSSTTISYGFSSSVLPASVIFFFAFFPRSSSKSGVFVRHLFCVHPLPSSRPGKKKSVEGKKSPAKVPGWSSSPSSARRRIARQFHRLVAATIVGPRRAPLPSTSGRRKTKRKRVVFFLSFFLERYFPTLFFCPLLFRVLFFFGLKTSSLFFSLFSLFSLHFTCRALGRRLCAVLAFLEEYLPSGGGRRRRPSWRRPRRGVRPPRGRWLRARLRLARERRSGGGRARRFSPTRKETEHREERRQERAPR